MSALESTKKGKFAVNTYLFDVKCNTSSSPIGFIPTRDKI